MAGFTLIEAVVALAIIGMISVTALAAFAAELRTSGRAERALVAAALAEEQLQRLRLVPSTLLSPLPDSLARGTFPRPYDRYTWTAAATPARDEDDLYEVVLQVSRQGEGGGAYTLRSRVYRPGPALAMRRGIGRR
jgi:prepilin-type N-terminal cleavage/methylation domain-containing protein